MLSNVQSYSLNGHELACLVQGEGVPLVLVHGSLCDYRYWQWQLRGLGERYRLLAPSLRHYYPQRWNGEGADFTTAQHVEDLLALIDMQGEPVHLLGHSRGGNICLRLALEAPGRLRSLVLCDPGGDFAADLFQAAGVPVPAAPAERNRFREQALQLIRQGEVEAGLELFVDTVSGPGIWRRSSRHFRDMATDNAMTLIGQVADRPEPLGRAPGHAGGADPAAARRTQPRALPAGGPGPGADVAGRAQQRHRRRFPRHERHAPGRFQSRRAGVHRRALMPLVSCLHMQYHGDLPRSSGLRSFFFQ